MFYVTVVSMSTEGISDAYITDGNVDHIMGVQCNE